MSDSDAIDWNTNEWFMPRTTAAEPARPKARAATGKLPPDQAEAIADVRERYNSDRNDDLPTNL
jgi:hypothetical protein